MSHSLSRLRRFIRSTSCYRPAPRAFPQPHRSFITSPSLLLSTSPHACLNLDRQNIARKPKRDPPPSPSESSKVDAPSQPTSPTKQTVPTPTDPEDKLRHMIAQKLKPPITLIIAVMKEYAALGDLTSLDNLSLELEHYRHPPSIQVYTQYVVACGNSTPPNVKVAEEVIGEARKKKLVFDRQMYEAMLSLYAHAGDRLRTTRVFKDMVHASVKPSVRAYASMMTACGKDGDVQTAMELLKKIHSSGLKPTIATYTSLLQSCGRHLNLDQISAIEGEVREASLDVDTRYQVALIAAHVKGGRYRKALDLERDLRNSDLVLNAPANDAKDLSRSLTMYEWLFRAAIELRDVKSSERLFVQMKKDRVRPNRSLYEKLITFFRSEDLSVALSLLGQMEHSGIDIVETTRSMIAGLTTHQKNFQEVYQKRFDLVEILEELPDPVESSRAYEALLNVVMPDIELAHHLYLRTCEHHIELSTKTLSRLYTMFISSNQAKNADVLLNRDASSCVGALAYVQQNSIEETIQKLIHAGWTPDDETLSYALSCSVDDIDRFQYLLYEVFERRGWPIGVQCIQQALVAVGKTAEVDVSSEIPKILKLAESSLGLQHENGGGNALDARSFTALLQTLISSDLFDEAWRYYQRMKDNQVTPVAYTFSILVKGAIESGREDLVETIVGDMKAHGLKMNHKLKKMVQKVKQKKQERQQKNKQQQMRDQVIRRENTDQLKYEDAPNMTFTIIK